MLNTTEIVIQSFVRHLTSGFERDFGTGPSSRPQLLAVVARQALERIADTDALYHNMEHTILVTLVGQEILRGRRIRFGDVDENDWLHFTAALLCHDIGFIRGACFDDRPPNFVVDDDGRTVELPRGASDAALARYHVDRGKIFVRERLGHIADFDTDRLAAAIELTRFPVPEDGDHDDIANEPGLVRAADLIGQMADPHYMRKINALYVEFRETGMAEKLGYETPADLAEAYPKFYWQAVRPYITPALDLLRLTQEGKQWIANLYAHVFAAEHAEFSLGPERSLKTENEG